MKTIVEKKKATVEDYMKLPEGAPYELINGELVMSPSPLARHQRIQLAIASELYEIEKEKKFGEVFIAPFDVHLDDENVFQPDIFIMLKDNPVKVDDDDWVWGVPDLVIEILSPSNSYFDTQKKLRIYERFGVREYFIIDPEDKMVTAYSSEDGKYREQYREESLIKSKLLSIAIKF
ncbi:MAG TPA: Uma2 family endonuclease [Chitinophagales bacterium]|nr:Uma2 family endonuclease [Chitinophagales bacterium]